LFSYSRIALFANIVFAAVFLHSSGLHALPGAGPSTGNNDVVEKLECIIPDYVQASAKLVPLNVTPELGFDASHVQGLVVTEEYFFLSSVYKQGFTAWLFRMNRHEFKLEKRENLARLMDFHPGGIDYDGKYLWVPVAVYSPESHTNMIVVDPETLKYKVIFEVADHIGAVARSGNLVIGANWNARQFYFWTLRAIPFS